MQPNNSHREEAERQAIVIDEINSEISNNTKHMIISILVCVISFLLAIVFAFLSVSILYYLLIAIAFISFFVFCYFLSEKKRCSKDLVLAMQKFEEYEKMSETRAKETDNYYQAQHKQWEINHPICPACGGRNTSRISTMNRTVSVATFGLASSKIGKQYECKSCKHKW